MTKPTNMNENRSSSIEAEALAWIAQLDGDNISEKDLVAFREWVNRSPAHAREIRELNSLWDELSVLTDMVGPIAEADFVSNQLRRRESFRAWRRRLAFPAAVLALVAAVSIPIRMNQMASHVEVVQTAEVELPTIYRTEIGEHQEYTLADGSKLTLNTGSRVEVDYRKDQRRLRLLQGEALFDVAHDTSRPFLVYAGEGIVRAVGTAFVVHLQGNEFDVIVSEGSVELSSVLPSPVIKSDTVKPKKIASLGIVKAGHKAKYENSIASIATLSDVEMTAKMSWQRGLISFHGETLEEVIREVSRYTELNIEIRDPELKRLQVGGVFKSGDTESVFANLKANFDIDTLSNKPGSVILVRKQ